MKPVIYIRDSLAEEEEVLAVRSIFKDRVVTQRTKIPKDSLVIPRYTALPFNKELCEDIKELGSVPINTNRQHNYVANMDHWYTDLEGLTPKTWFSLDQIPEEGPFFLKGSTNSRKHQWKTHCFAANKKEAGEVYWRLTTDGLIGTQQIVIREFVPLNTLMTGLNGLPISEEYRFFVLDNKVIASGFYWSSHVDQLLKHYDPAVVPRGFLDEVIARVDGQCRFWVVDVARTASGDWIVVELNDGQQSGLSTVNPVELYTALDSLGV